MGRTLGFFESFPFFRTGSRPWAIVGNGGLTPSVLGTVEEWLELKASVRRAGEQRGCLSLAPRGGLERGGDEPPARG